MNTLRAEAERLRDEGYTYNMITEALGIASSTMSYWFKDRPFTPNYAAAERIKHGPLKGGAIKHNRKVSEVAELRKLGIEEVGKLSDRDLWMLGIGLYIGEGAKTIEAVRISNSDPAVVALAIRWLKECCNLSDDNITVKLHLYPDNDIAVSTRYWQTITNLPEARFRRFHVDTRRNKKQSRRGKLPYGTAHISVVCRGDSEKGAKLYRRLSGWMAGALGQL